MATFLAKITIFEGKEAAFEETARMMWEATHAHEPNCRRYEYWRGAEPRSYYCLESFTDYQSFIGHQASPHHEAPDFGSMLESIDIEWLDPLQGASGLTPTESQAMPDDSSDLMKQYAEGFPVVMQAWWKALRLI
jgi:quinol monooxygenase YgiN